MTTSTMEKIQVMLAFDEGRQIEFLEKDFIKDGWVFTSHPSWNWADFDFRIKPDPPRKFTRWFIELPGSRFVGPFYDEDTAKTSQYLYGNSTITAFEMTEIPENAS